MTETSFPFSSSPIQTEDNWRQFMKNVLGDGVYRGVANELETFGDSSGMQVKVKSGGGIVQGTHYNNSAQLTKGIDTNTSGSTRVDRVVLRLDTVGDTITAEVVKGTPGAGTPALTQTSATWEVPLGKVTIPTGTTAGITAGMVTDDRQFASAHTERGDGAVALTNDSPNAGSTWEAWGGGGDIVSFTTPRVPIIVRGWVVGNLNGDGLAAAQTGESRIECSFDGGSSWSNVMSSGPTGMVSNEAGETRDALASQGRFTGTPTGTVQVRAAIRSDSTSVLFANGYLMADWRVA